MDDDTKAALEALHADVNTQEGRRVIAAKCSELGIPLWLAFGLLRSA